MMRRPLMLAMILAITAIFWLFIRTPQSEETTAATNPLSAPQPGFAATDAVLIQTGDDGQPLYTLHATHISQPQTGEPIEVTDPDFTDQVDADNRWNVRALRGELPPAADHVELYGNVNARGDRTGLAPLLLHTEQLGFDMPTQIITTDNAVTAEWGNARLNSQGLQADLKTHNLILQANVHGQIAP
jgi:LPS export ABC transporter protein LptC